MNMNKVNICNMALALVGADIISEQEEPSKEAKACKIFYENAKNKALAKYDWPFASKTLLLNRLKKSELSMKSRFKLPADCLIPREIINSGEKSFVTQGNVLLTEHRFY